MTFFIHTNYFFLCCRLSALFVSVKMLPALQSMGRYKWRPGALPGGVNNRLWRQQMRWKMPAKVPPPRAAADANHRRLLTLTFDSSQWNATNHWRRNRWSSAQRVAHHKNTRQPSTCQACPQKSAKNILFVVFLKKEKKKGRKEKEMVRKNRNKEMKKLWK